MVVLAVKSRDPEVKPCCPAMYYPAEVDISGNQREVARNHQSEESDSVKLRDSSKAYSFGVRVFWHSGTRTIELRFPAQ